MKKDPNKGYIALLGWSLNAVEAAEKFDRRYVVVAPDWAEAYCQEHDIPYVPWNFERLNDRSMEIAQTLKDMGERGDIIKAIHRSLKDEGHTASLVTERNRFDPSRLTASPVTGVVKQFGRHDDTREGGFVIIRSLDGEHIHTKVSEGETFDTPRKGQVITLQPHQNGARKIDHSIADFAKTHDGIYSEARHATEGGNVSPAYARAHIRRLEALRKTKLVTRHQDGTWHIPKDYLERASGWLKIAKNSANPGNDIESRLILLYPVLALAGLEDTGIPIAEETGDHVTTNLPADAQTTPVRFGLGGAITLTPPSTTSAPMNAAQAKHRARMTEWQEMDAARGDQLQAKRDAELIFSLFDGFGIEVPVALWDALLTAPYLDDRQTVSTAVSHHLETAAMNLQRAKAVALALQAQQVAGAPNGDPKDLSDAIGALNHIGLTREARRLAVEILMTRGQ